jgi:hypothetical protein
VSELGGSTGGSAVAGATTVGVGGGATAPGPSGGAEAAGSSGGLSGWLLGAGVTSSDATAGGTAPEPNGGATLLGRLFSDAGLPLHGHEDDAGGGVLDYARLVVSDTTPAAPAAPSDAFWLNPSESA